MQYLCLIFTMITRYRNKVVFLKPGRLKDNQKQKDFSQKSKYFSLEDVKTVIKLLLDKGADVNIKDKYGKTILEQVNEEKPRYNYDEVVRLLKAAGAKTVLSHSVISQASTDLSGADIEFLKQCRIQQTDIDIIPKLGKKTQTEMYAWIDARDCGKLEPFKISRNYLRTFRPNTHPPAAPEGFTLSYFTNAEVEYYWQLSMIPPSFK